MENTLLYAGKTLDGDYAVEVYLKWYGDPPAKSIYWPQKGWHLVARAGKTESTGLILMDGHYKHVYLGIKSRADALATALRGRDKVLSLYCWGKETLSKTANVPVILKTTIDNRKEK